CLWLRIARQTWAVEHHTLERLLNRGCGGNRCLPAERGVRDVGQRLVKECAKIHAVLPVLQNLSKCRRMRISINRNSQPTSISELVASYCPHLPPSDLFKSRRGQNLQYHGPYPARNVRC